MEEEKKFLSNAWDASVYQEFIVKKHNLDYPGLVIDISKNIKIYNDLFYKKMFDAMKKETPEAMNIYEKEMNKIRKEHMNNISSIHFFASSLWIKMKSLVGIDIKDFGYVSKYLAHTLIYVSTPTINRTYIDYLNHIQKNKLFLEQLGNQINKSI